LGVVEIWYWFGLAERNGWAEFWLWWAAWLGGILAGLGGLVGWNFGCGGRHGWAEFWLGWAAWLGGILAGLGGMVGRNFGWAAWLALSNLNELHSNECAFNQLDGL
jgi:hypothetical protein